MANTTTELLEQVNQAISDLLTSGVASWGDNGKTVTMNDLAKLQALRTQLLQEQAWQNGGNFRFASPLGRS